jgi:uncharacterized damage-inducible protein DinB
MRKPQPEEYAQSTYTSRYIALVNSDDVIAELGKSMDEVQKLFSSLSDTQLNFSYAPGKWTLKELLAHMIDTERILSYRALCIARGEKQSLPGFDENEYAEQAQSSRRSIKDLLREYQLVREANILMFNSFDEQMLSEVGTANGKSISARALLFIIAGHERHHLSIVKEKYLNSELYR